jgi:RND family efflux transporter MFP subunit
MYFPSSASLFICALAALALCGCRPEEKKPAAIPPAKVDAVLKEGELNTLHLTPEAEQRLGIVNVAVELRELPRLRTYGGEVTQPTDALQVISAPVGGTLRPPSPDGLPQVGTTVEKDQPMVQLMPLLSPERDVLTPPERLRLAEARNAIATSRIDAASQVEQAEVQHEAARINLERSERLLRESAGTVRAVDDAKAQLSLADKALQAAKRRKQLLDEINLDEDAGDPRPLTILAPQSGLIRARSASAGEIVASGAPLFEVLRIDPVWLRVPVYAGDLNELAPGQPAEVTSLESDPAGRTITAPPVAAPPTATPLAATVDLYFELSNTDGALRPGQRLAVRLKLRDSGEQRVLPWSAVVHDIHGGAWVYVNTGPQTYVRQRVQVRYVVDGQAVLASGPAVGKKVATVGVVELFSTEFGFAK